MPRNLSKSDPVGDYKRKVKAELRIGGKHSCACGESRPEALIGESNGVLCASCQRRERGRSPFDDHHIAGKSNSPLTLRVPVNDHRAELSTRQYDWPRFTLENPDGDPLLKGAAKLRGVSDALQYFSDSFLLPLAEDLEAHQTHLVRTFGKRWWER